MMSLLPSAEVREMLRVRVVAPLGGRINQHWFVEPWNGREPLVLRRWGSCDRKDVGYELRLLKEIEALGWPVSSAVGEVVELEGSLWSLFPFLSGEPRSQESAVEEQRGRGRLLAQFHESSATLQGFGQRGQWRRCEEILEDGTLDQILADNEKMYPEEVRTLRWHLERARARLGEVAPETWPGLIVHGDFTTWNLRFENGRLSGVLDFELAHMDHRIADFALAWRGKYDEVILGYNEVALLSEEERALVTPMWLAFLVEQCCRVFEQDGGVDEWSLKKLLERTPLMGVDATEYR